MKNLGTIVAAGADGQEHSVPIYPHGTKPDTIPVLHPDWPKEYFAVIEMGDLSTEAIARIFKHGSQKAEGTVALYTNEHKGISIR